jgi:Kef-type K+ transport system membrane component KefB
MIMLAANGGEAAGLLFPLFVMFLAAKVLAELFERLRQPAVAGEILAGVLIGPSVLGWVNPTEVTHAFSEMGVVFLLFQVGLETKPSSILKVGRQAFLVATLGIAVPFLGGMGVMLARGSSGLEAAFVGTALVATSVGITARVLSAQGALHLPASQIILGAAVIDDILGLLVLAVVSSFAKGSVNYLEIAWTTGLSFVFTAAAALVVAPLMNRLAPWVRRLRLGHAVLVLSLGMCLGLSVVAAWIGIAAIIGAFLAGMALSEATQDDHSVHQQASGITEFFVPFFLTSIGMQLKLEVFQDPATLGLAVLVTGVAVLTKVVGCGLGVVGQGWKRAAQVGVGMIPRGEVGIVVAQIGLTLGIVSDALFGVVVAMAVATTLVAPPLLQLLFRGAPARAGG